ncbi:MAG: dTDP-4-dehydrorhamnose 3,5-epimerase family protein [Verrucomicrobiia bacterium]
MSFHILAEPLPGTYHLSCPSFPDRRGSFSKPFAKPRLEAVFPDFQIAEVFYSKSVQNVVRGMHFQTPPHAHRKLVHCSHGKVLDVLLDLRLGSPAYGKSVAIELDGSRSELLAIPIGVAHGFLTRSEESALWYFTDVAHAPEHDTGVRWDSFGHSWPVVDAILSDRDATLPRLQDFTSPFVFP